MCYTLVPRGALELVMANLTLYLPDDLAYDLRVAAEADGRSVSNFAVVQLRAVLRAQFDATHPAAVREAEELRARLDLERPAAAPSRPVDARPHRRTARHPGRGR